MRVGIACGGTGGHVFPGLAVAEVLRDRGHTVALWIGARGVESLAVKEWQGEAHRVEATGFPARRPERWVGSAARLVSGFLSARARMRRPRLDVLLAMGGYASVAPALAAWSRNIPIVVHEANAVPGRAVSFLSRLATATAVAFEEAGAHLPRGRIVMTGFPVRRNGGSRFAADELPGGGFTVLVMGGSQGARVLNETATAALCGLHRQGERLRVIHLAGSADAARVAGAYDAVGVRHATFDFLKEMEKAYNAADLAVSRAGAAACAELCMSGVPALLVPLPWAARDHQTANARVLAGAGAAELLVQDALSADSLASAVCSCMVCPERLAGMRKAMKALCKNDAAERIAVLIEETGAARGMPRQV